MKNRKKVLIMSVVVLVIIGLIIGGYFTFRSPWEYRGDEPIKVFYVASYKADVNPWIKPHILEFEEVFDDNGVSVDIYVFEMDTLTNTSEEWKRDVSLKAKKLIDSFDPDLIFATDDNAQEYLISPYYLNSDIPVVVAALDRDPAVYGYVGSKNVAGVREVEHVEDAISLLQSLYPYARKIAIISEDINQWDLVLERIKMQQSNFPEMEFVGFNRVSTFNEFKEDVLFYQKRVDAFLFTPFDGLVDDFGVGVPREDVLRWNVENNNLPEVSLWMGPSDGVLAGVAISHSEQGREAGKMAYEILINGRSPSSLGFKSTKKGDQYINLARADTLDLEVSSIILINSEVIEEFPWEKK